MSTTPLTNEEQELLNEVVARRDPRLQAIAGDAAGRRKLSSDEANALRDAIGEELARTGVDAGAGAANERGRRLDDLIDRIAALSDLHDT